MLTVRARLPARYGGNGVCCRSTVRNLGWKLISRSKTRRWLSVLTQIPLRPITCHPDRFYSQSRASKSATRLIDVRRVCTRFYYGRLAVRCRHLKSIAPTRKGRPVNRAALSGTITCHRPKPSALGPEPGRCNAAVMRAGRFDALLQRLDPPFADQHWFEPRNPSCQSSVLWRRNHRALNCGCADS